MKDKKLKKYLQQSLQKEPVPGKRGGERPDRREETIKLCIEIMQKKESELWGQEKARTGFMQYLSDIFRFEGMPVLGLQAAVLFIVCLAISTTADRPSYIPAFIPLFVLAVIPVMFKC